ncbi:MAG TPA: epoxyqueuosine reductase, partial [Methanobacterium sp.]|nr:epoxyqueuosine reductase [Methanobacterium sp.]
MSINDKLKEQISLDKINYFGVADLTPVKQFIESQGGRLVSKYPKAISIGIILPNSIIDELPRRNIRTVAVNY